MGTLNDQRDQSNIVTKVIETKRPLALLVTDPSRDNSNPLQTYCKKFHTHYFETIGQFLNVFGF